MSTFRSKAHLAFVRLLPCSWCGAMGPSEASHHGVHGTALKSPDTKAIPLCTRCHRAHHGKEGLPGSHMDREQTRDWFVGQAWRVCSLRIESLTKKEVPND